MPPQRRSTGITFWGMVVGVMAALKLKEKWDDYRQVPTEPDGETGPLALHSPSGSTPDLPMLDTNIPATNTRKTRKKADCCMCCGLRCGLFWKAFGIVCALLLGWQLIQFIIWMVKPTPTGLENMPVFSKSLPCANAPHLYQGSEKITYSVPVDSEGQHSIDLRGRLLGDYDASDVTYQMTVRTNNQALLDLVTVQYPSKDDGENLASRLRLSTPQFGTESCMRYDMTVYVPYTVRRLDIAARTTTQVKFDDESNLDLDSLSIRVTGSDDTSMILPHRGVHASALTMDLQRGWLVGDVTIEDQTTLSTARGDAALNVHVFPAPSTAEPPADAHLTTHPGHPHRPIDSTHRVQGTGDLYLTYKDAAFSGTVDLATRSFTASGPLHDAIPRIADQLPWVGEKDGADKMVVESKNGWVGLYF
ncbi:uncharacterized protein B0H18DRAFT_1177025 [Fomitopsis serialis]|uniref:uncharacterized protein n=1 Tax=Fomitopsis serialis TaxID=139415 RepID=UPI002007B8EB|nr:uncharacterized protein B0H18DRAFT_1177025 [Neoantrodia serialis]KAH9910631.1 hypothetical protein B0H18DRAFT_1177025 [Neoantrodia serialis]